MIDAHGQDRPDGTVALGCSQAELSSLSGFARNDGRVYAYLRDLGDVVVRRRGEVVLDRDRLVELERSMVVRPLTRRTMEVGGQLAAAFGRPAADGTTVLSVSAPEGDRPARLSDMAAVLGMNRSSAHRHLRGLRGGGRLDPPPQSGESADEVVELRHRVGLLEEIVALDQQIITAMTRRAEVAAQLGLTAIDDDGPRLDPRDPRLLRAENPADRAEKSADSAPQSAGSPDQDEIREDKRTSSSLLSSPRSAYDPAECAPKIPRTADTRSANQRPCTDPEPSSPADHRDRDWGDEGWNADRLEELCAELLQACDDLGKPGPTNRQGLLQALAPYSPERIRWACQRLAHDMRGGRVQRPFGLLVAAAGPDHESHRLYFPPKLRPTDEPTPRAQVAAPADRPEDQEALDAVTALVAANDSQALEDLDRAILVCYANRPRSLEQLRGDPEAWHRLRADNWRLQHPLAPRSDQ